VAARGPAAPPGFIRPVGFDDVRYATLLSAPPTSIHQPRREIAAVALRPHRRPQLPPRTIRLTPRLVVRKSCGAYPPRG